MKKKILSCIMAATSVAMFGLFYPEYILLPETYDYIAETVPYETEYKGDLTELLHAKPEGIRISSGLLQILEEEGISLWKNRD